MLNSLKSFQLTPDLGCSDNMMFSTSTNSFTEGKLTCYSDEGLELEKKEEELFSPGTTCLFLSSGHASSGGFILEMFCRLTHWKVTITVI